MRNNKLIFQTQWRFKSLSHDKIALRSNDNKRIQSVDSIEKYGARKDLVSEKKMLIVTT